MNIYKVKVQVEFSNETTQAIYLVVKARNEREAATEAEEILTDVYGDDITSGEVEDVIQVKKSA